MELGIRPVREEDAAAIVALLNPIIEAGVYTAMTEPATVESQLAFQRGFPASGIFLAAIRGEEVLGIQDVIDGEISTFVRLDAHRRGIGRALMEATLPLAHARGFRTIRATIRADNAGAIAYYSQYGFRPVSRSSLQVVLEKRIQA